MADDADALLRRRRDLLREQAGLDKLPETWLPKWDAWEADVARYLEGTPHSAARRVDAAVELTVRQAIIDWNRAHVEPGRPFPPLDIDKHQEGSLAEAVLGAMIRLTADTKPSSSTRALTDAELWDLAHSKSTEKAGIRAVYEAGLVHSATPAITLDQLEEIKEQCEAGLTFSPEHNCPATFALSAIWAELFAEEARADSASDQRG